jgi:hypothetical protein
MKIYTTKKGEQVKMDDDTYELIKDRSWYLDTKGYLCRKQMVDGKYKFVYLHKMLCPVKEGNYVDHIDNDKLNNQRENLREATPAQSACNTRRNRKGASQYKGVSKVVSKYKDKEYVTWTARVKKDGKVVYNKGFKTEIEAAKAYDIEAEKAHGEFAYKNFPTL